MTGEQLYALYVEANAQQNIVVDSWTEISELGRQVWHELAQLLP